MNAELVVRRSGDVLHLVLAAPQRRNALSRSLLQALEAALCGVGDDVGGVVISGAGGAFSAGADFAELDGTALDATYDDEVSRVRDAIMACERLVIAAIEGPCLGAAVDLALSCDARIAAAGSYLEVPATRLGLLYNPVAVAHLLRSYGVEPVRRLLLLGERLPAEVAVGLGLITRVVAKNDAVAAAEALLAGVPRGGLPAVSATKALLGAYAEGDALEDLDEWQRRRFALLDSPERRAAAVAARARHVPPAARPDRPEKDEETSPS